MEINGIAHVQLSVADLAKSRPFYVRLLGAMGMTVVTDNERVLYCVGGRTAVAISPCDATQVGERFNQRRIGLHHVCFRARARADVDALYRVIQELGATVVYPPREGPWAPGYYSVAFEDPDGIRMEVNHVPGKGVFELPDGPKVDF